MRNVVVIMMTACMVLLTQCRKNVEQINIDEPAANMIDVVLTANTGGEKTEIDGLSVSWVGGDKLYVVGSIDGLLGSLTAQSSGNSVEFKGSIKETTASQKYNFYYVGKNTFNLTGDCVYTFEAQTQNGLLSDGDYSIANRYQLMRGTLYVEGTPGTVLGPVTLNNMISIARLNISSKKPITSAFMGMVSVEGLCRGVKINTKTGEYISIVSGDPSIFNTSSDYYMAIIPDNQSAAGTEKKLRFRAWYGEDIMEYMSTSFITRIAANKFYNRTSPKLIYMVPERLDGLFSVASNRKVYFSRGNLYWDRYSFEMEENQYDFRTWGGGASCIGGTYSTKGTPAGNCGLFFWENYDRMAESYSSSYVGTGASASDNIFTNDGVTSSYYKFEVCGHNDFWRTLSIEEWGYLINSRSGNRYAYARVNDIPGLILYPDGYTGTSSGTGIGTNNAVGSSFPTSSIPPSTWTNMENAGVVFLPCAGVRYGTTVQSVKEMGSYWSSSNPSSGNHAFNIYYHAGTFDDFQSGRNGGYSIRLAKTYVE